MAQNQLKAGTKVRFLIPYLTYSEGDVGYALEDSLDGIVLIVRNLDSTDGSFAPVNILEVVS